MVQPTSTRIIFRWQGVPCNFNGVECRGLLEPGSSPVNFEIELNTDGTIRTRYGSGNTRIKPTVGIGGGDQDGYVIASHTSDEEFSNLLRGRLLTLEGEPV